MTGTHGPVPQGTLDLLILKTLAEGARHGYAIARAIEDTTDDALSIEEGALYPALHRMQRRGWIAAERATSELGKVIKRYDLTTKGRAELRRRTLQWASLIEAVGKVLRTRS